MRAALAAARPTLSAACRGPSARGLPRSRVAGREPRALSRRASPAASGSTCGLVGVGAQSARRASGGSPTLSAACRGPSARGLSR